MKLVVKIGGALLDAPESRNRLAAEIADVARAGHAVVVVHGGGKQMTSYLAERGIATEFVNGLRVTTPAVLDAVLKVFAGAVNHELVAAFVKAGAAAVGLTGMDAGLTEAIVLNPDLGAVGKVVRSNPRVLEVLTANDFVPVIACVAGDSEGRFYNVNADAMAVSCAAAFGASKLFFLTDVEGVRDVSGAACPELTAAGCARFIEAGVATGGMLAKLESATAALRAGISEVVIAPGAQTGIVAKLLAGESCGTRIIPGHAEATVAQ